MGNFIFSGRGGDATSTCTRGIATPDGISVAFFGVSLSLTPLPSSEDSIRGTLFFLLLKMYGAADGLLTVTGGVSAT